MAQKKIGIRDVNALGSNETIWDSAVTGFCARRRTGAAIFYGLKYRTADGRQRWHTIGRHGAPWTPDQARIEAQRLLGDVVTGGDPSGAKATGRAALTVAELCDQYLEAADAGRILTRRKIAKKASTLATDKGRVERHIKPLLGKKKVGSVTSDDIEQFRDDVTNGKTKGNIKTGLHGLARVTGGQGTATRTMGLLGAIFAFAVKKKLRPDNPVRGVDRHADGKRTRRLSADEYSRLGETLRSMPETTWPSAIAGIKFLALTGWRRGEMTSLRWSDVDLATRTARLSDTKTGSSMRPLSKAACDILRGLPRFGELVFPSSMGVDQAMNGFHKVWLRVAAKATLPSDVTPHVLRHSLASTAADLGMSELTIATLLGHKKATVTSGYVHHADAVLLAAADAVADAISAAMGDVKEPGKVIALESRRPANG